jgi:hypothetical protein
MRIRKLVPAAATVVAIGLVASACTGSEQPEYTVEASWDYQFDSLVEMAATADVVIVGTVAAVGPGREMYACDDPSGACAQTEENYAGQVREVTVTVDEQLGGAASVGGTITLEEWGYDRKGNPFEIDEAPWSRVGDGGALFLQHGSQQPAGSYQLIHPVGRILTHRGAEDGSGASFASQQAVSFAHNELADELRATLSSDVRDLVSAAIQTAAAEGIPPRQPMDWLETPEEE